MEEILNKMYPIGHIYTVFHENSKLPQIGKWEYIGSEFSIIGIVDHYVRIKWFGRWTNEKEEV